MLVLQAEKVLQNSRMIHWGKVYPGMWTWQLSQALVTGFACNTDPVCKATADTLVYQQSFRMHDEREPNKEELVDP